MGRRGPHAVEKFTILSCTVALLLSMEFGIFLAIRDDFDRTFLKNNDADNRGI